ncbi:MAG: hypothetical protein MZW92_68150 [Comamonadaceae bacterium]|nr:hypothetical protein [Comamonadaceae bacterium]
MRYGSHVAVRRIEDLEFLIQESEIATGQPGREFFALRPQPARYRVGKRGAWFEVQLHGPLPRRARRAGRCRRRTSPPARSARRWPTDGSSVTRCRKARHAERDTARLAGHRAPRLRRGEAPAHRLVQERRRVRVPGGSAQHL